MELRLARPRGRALAVVREDGPRGRASRASRARRTARRPRAGCSHRGRCPAKASRARTSGASETRISRAGWTRRMRHYTPWPVLTPFHVVVVCALALPALASAGDRVGPETCKACHPAAYTRWRAGPHARARESLPEKSRDDRRCLSCHAPDAAEGISGVSCEACHGPGALYAASYVMRDPELSRALGLVDPGEKILRRVPHGLHPEPRALRREAEAPAHRALGRRAEGALTCRSRWSRRSS